jgi:prephenate dehydrogenase
MKVAVIGLGLIGGSMAIDLKKAGFASKIIGVDNNQINAEFAKKIGFIDEIESLENAVYQSELIILAIPVDATLTIANQVLDLVESQVVTDVCSTKEVIYKRIQNHSKRKQFVLGHPMAGTEFSGPWAAKEGLFTGKACILCDTSENNQKALEHVEKLYDALNMRIIEMGSQDHDIHAAYVSHISHISSFALALTVLEKEKDEKQIFNLASGGFDSTVRLAKSSADMWSPIFDQNKDNVLTVLETYIEKLNQFKKSIELNNKNETKALIEEANKIKKVLN